MQRGVAGVAFTLPALADVATQGYQKQALIFWISALFEAGEHFTGNRNPVHSRPYAAGHLPPLLPFHGGNRGSNPLGDAS